jgi:hypothetical protein
LTIDFLFSKLLTIIGFLFSCSSSFILPFIFQWDGVWHARWI